MSRPFCCVLGRGDQENSTVLTPGSASNITGAPDGAIGGAYVYKTKRLYEVCIYLSQGLLVSCFVAQRDPQ